MRNRPSLVVQALLASCLFAAPSLLAQQGEASEVEAFAVIQAEYDAAYQQWMDTYREVASSGADKDVISKLRAERPSGTAYLDRVVKILNAKPASEDGASAAIWMLGVVRVKGAQLGSALDVLQKHHADSKQLKRVMLALSRNATPAVAVFLEKVSATSTSSEIRGRTSFALAEHFKTRANTIRAIAMADGKKLVRIVGTLGSDVVDVLRCEDPVAAEDNSSKWCEAVINDAEFAAIEYFRGTLGEHAERSLYELRHLSIGKVAPDIIGEDIDGTAMKLSDYRGKVVVIDFWGDW
tara:strand:+ start:803 stop:1687 length:885 start_codon:yes stop_codon:yes gene_type:complete